MLIKVHKVTGEVQSIFELPANFSFDLNDTMLTYSQRRNLSADIMRTNSTQ